MTNYLRSALGSSGGFINDISGRAGCRLIGVDVGTQDPSSTQTLKAFDATMETLLNSDPPIRPRAVILCNPNNPLGFNYPRETLLAYCEFAQKWDLHLLSDEIYALSQFENAEKEREGTKRSFVSMLNVDIEKETRCEPSRVHVLYGMSKDFCANGLRLGKESLHSRSICLTLSFVGVMVTQHNPELRKTLLGISLLMKVSSPAVGLARAFMATYFISHLFIPQDALWSGLLNDDQMLEYFITTNQKKLGDTLKHCQIFFSKYGIPLLQPEAAHFIFSACL